MSTTGYRKRLSALLSFIMVLTVILPMGQALAAAQTTAIGQVLDERSMELAPGATYTNYDLQMSRGPQKVHAVEFNPANNPALALEPGMTDGKVYGMQGVTKMASDADKTGNRVIAAVNGDFYDLSTGVPLGLFMGGGKILTSPPSNWFAFGIKPDGSTLYGPSPELARTVTIQGTTTPISHINRLRSTDALILYSSDFHTSTTTNDLGDEVVLDIVSGELKTGSTMTLRVKEVHKNKGNTMLAPGQVVLSASGTKRSVLNGLQAGDEVTASFQLEQAWQNVTMSIGGNVLLVQDGNVIPQGDTSLAPRTAIGTKADGSVVMLEMDGRQPGVSEGMQLQEVGQLMKDMGVVNALNLDGGGSSTFVARLPGETARKVLNRPSDGSERKTANGILLVNRAPEGPASRLVVKPSTERVLTGSSFTFSTAGIDAQGHPASFTGTPVWTVNPSIGAIDNAGQFTAGMVPGVSEINVAADGLTGIGNVEVVNQLTELKFADAEKTLGSGSSEKINVIALRNGQVIQAANNQMEWSVEGPIGTITADGVFTATTETEKTGKIIVKYKGIEASLNVNVGLPPVILEDFETNLDRYYPSAGAQYNTTTVSLESEEEFVRFGNKALKLAYDFTGKPGTSGAYLQAKNAANYIQIPGYPEKISMWVYGDGNKHWLRAQLRDPKGAIGLDFVDQTIGVDFKGWKYMEAAVPKGRALPLTMDMPVRYMETQAAKKDAGAIYVDNIRALYGPAKDDMDPPIIKKISPAQSGITADSTPVITAYGEDYGYNQATHPGTTLIDPDKIRMYVDGSLVPHALYPPEGKIHYTPNVPLADGVHQVKVQVKDLSGNQTTKEWTFQVDTDSAKLSFTTPPTVYSGHIYALQVTAEKVKSIRNAQVEWGFDPSKIEDVHIVHGAKLSGANVSSVINSTYGTVQLNMNNIHLTDLNDTDEFISIQYKVKPTAKDANLFRFVKGIIQFTDTGDTAFPFFGLPISSEIRQHLQLEWDPNGVAQGFFTSISVKDEQGLPVQGAAILADGASIGVTDAQGKLMTSTLTQTVKEYQLQAKKNNQYSAVMPFKVFKLAGSAVPHNISVGMGDDAATSRKFIWHTHPLTEETVVELVEEKKFTDFNASNVEKYTGNTSLYNTLDLGTVRVHKAEANKLKQGTSYVYRVGDGKGNYSAQGKFSTASNSEGAMKFLYFADSQASDLKGYQLWGNTVQKAMDEHPDAQFVMHAGDMVDKGYLENEWNMWYSTAQEQLLKTTLVSVIGNHEYSDKTGNSDFNAHFNQAGNGLENLKGTNFSFNYKNAHFVVLNSERDYEAQKEWLEKDLAQSKSKWTIAMFHRGPYGSIYDTLDVRNLWAPVLEANGVDLVLNGHDHIYLRTHPMKGGKIVPDGQGTNYVVAGSTGPKFYSLTERPWQKVTDAELTQMYASIEITKNTLTFITKTVGGRVVDSFTLGKQEESESIRLDKPEVKLKAGEQTKLQATVSPDSADQSVTWSVYSSQPAAGSTGSVVSVQPDGTVLAIAEGNAVVRAASVVHNVYADSLITVEPGPSVTPEVTGLSLTGKASYVIGESAPTVLESVYSNGTTAVVNNGALYTSSDSSVATVNESGNILAVGEGTSVISAVYGGFRTSMSIEVKAKPSEPDPKPDPNPKPDPDSNPDPGPEPVVPPVIPNREIREVNGEMLKNSRQGQAYVLELTKEIRKLILPGNSLDLLNDLPLIIKHDQYSLSVPADVLKELLKLIPADQLASAKITLDMDVVDRSEVQQMMIRAEQQTSAKLKLAGDILDFSLSIITADGTKKALTEFKTPIEITLLVNSEGKTDLAGMYYFADNGTIEYVGGKLRDGKLTASVHHFSKYGVVEYAAEYADLPSDHWGGHAVAIMSSKHIAKGVGSDQFAPKRKTTRAEFAALVVRMLGIKADSALSFTDVPGNVWYADEVKAAAHAGIVTGTGVNQFSPDAFLTRQEMALMLIKAYEYAATVKVSPSAKSEFNDISQTPAWAKEAIAATKELNLLQGQGNNNFNPQGTATRAESIKALHNLYMLLDQA
ncbi:metallophosphoesterase [Paenibacillus swuensis]|uniref:Metallophosphoesterase n=1 Tax=Paenibacillus swuensis TaxID=1178515 RepID=A0A172TGR6_9BACL|nr:phosphodiester glycosidase family protein [Paenibacillus swuensis]ANE46231.1 metallophosphoesterase [Paenibacillus swuensis]